ncbi:mirror-image polydactyly gene 1 protein isoform X1 [Neopelma chrysocephalum]|uniref:mirror-image polydactyly gene 1 protein isoform X1 n=1 Tax=Neopelma chrysocephalum TaxID=114329 RepID=UPI000FCCF6A7|nr:mirror-image polydactyly gene 1 protein isoform X1 [Neopelma chrysocephalum]XP_027526826.1 mirror-image polydactyly gene 1 protein isoform X1 [Neopelma chrysocephalum]XP_027526834.1 mirror-image polydactyly gene 1 protein isoform X1 [Neopelma chrysocephalum]XP_027526842.1 mirror-image polydactyly gene 1 protein isoform X1 [Neopelma chrysocephalum]XP_027526849.1 mirror-image polydactyly gene 1 protein isoform X1 [Neopelma chrysocephalum]XP_027526858.1 mirror-image polydactyly gene 1 protein 
MSSEIFKQKLDSVPDQTSSKAQMENWSKETHILEQKKEDFCVGLQFFPNSQKNAEFFIQTETEAPKSSDLPVKSQRGGVLNDYSSGPEESSTVERKANRMLPEFIPSWKDAADLDGKTETAFLLKELDTLRAKNKKLQDNLAEKDKELKTMKLDLELQERATEAKIAEKIAALVEEVYSAQRERDEAVMARLRLANEERDEAFLRVQRLEQSLKELENINPEENDMTLQDLLNRINNADTGIDILKNGAIILNRIHRTKERKKKIIAEEMNAVIEQRDAALSQCKRLEQELHHLKEQNQTSANNTRHLTAENNQERALKAELITLQLEKEAALQQCKKLEEEIQTLRVYYSLYKSLSEGTSLKSQTTCAFSTSEAGLLGREDVVTLTYRQIEDLAAQLQQTRTEQKDTEMKLQKALEASREANEKVQKLERLVDVLRKKVGAGTIRTVI